MTISGLDTSFDNLLSLPTLSDQAVNVFSADDFAPNPHSHLLSYHRCHSSPLPYQVVNVSSINKPTNRYSRSTSLSTCSQTSVGTDTPWIHNPCPYYSYNSRHCLNMADSLKTMNQKLLRPKDWVLPTIHDSKKEFAELPIMDISMIGAAPFNTLVQ